MLLPVLVVAFDKASLTGGSVDRRNPKGSRKGEDAELVHPFCVYKWLMLELG